MRWLSFRTTTFAVMGLFYAVNPIYGDEVATTFSFQYSALRYQTSSLRVEPKDGTSIKADSTTSSTTGADSYAWITHGDWNFYLYPFTGGTTIGLSKMVTSNLELGAFLSLLKEDKDENDASKDTTYASPFLTYYIPVGTVTLENYASFDIAESEEESTDPITQVRSESKSDGKGATLQITAVFPISKTFFFVPSIKYVTSTSKDIADTETTITDTYITPFALRTSFN